jgi:sarcosine oxidase/L-pipecolate oxidase
MTTNNLLSTKLFGFIKGRSTVLQLLHVMDKWTTTLDQGGEVDIVFCDLMKPHRRLSNKLSYYGFRGPLLGWIRSFLASHTTQVVVKVLSGIPQGSVLSPVLFVSPTPKLYLFADETKIFRDIANDTDSQDLQSNLDAMWA